MLDGAGKPSVITHEALICLNLDKFGPQWITFLLTSVHTYPIVLGMPWLQRYDPFINWSLMTIHPSSYWPSQPVTSGSTPSLDSQSASPMDPIFSAQPLYPDEDSDSDTTPPPPTECALTTSTIEPHEPIILLRATTTTTTTESTETMDVSPSTATLNSQDDSAGVPEEYHEYLDVFSKKKADQLPPHWPFDHRITLEDGKTPPFGPIYPLSEKELAALREYLEENLPKGFVVPSELPAAAPILFVKKKDGTL